MYVKIVPALNFALSQTSLSELKLEAMMYCITINLEVMKQ